MATHHQRSHARIPFEEIKPLYESAQISATCAVRLALLAKRPPGSTLKIEDRAEFYQSLGMARSTFYKALKKLKETEDTSLRIEILYKRHSLEMRYERIERIKAQQLTLPELQPASPAETKVDQNTSINVGKKLDQDLTSNETHDQMLALGIDPANEQVKAAMTAYPNQVVKILDYMRNYRSPIRNANGFFVYLCTTTEPKTYGNPCEQSYNTPPENCNPSPRTSEILITPSGTGFGVNPKSKEYAGRKSQQNPPLEHPAQSRETPKHPPAKKQKTLPPKGDHKPDFLKDPYPGDLYQAGAIHNALKAGDLSFAILRLEQMITDGEISAVEEILAHHAHLRLTHIQGKIMEIPDDLSDILIAVKSQFKVLDWSDEQIKDFLKEHYGKPDTNHLDDRQLLDLKIRLEA